MVQRALISVSDKTGIVEFATSLAEMGVELISTGGTEKLLKESGIDVKNISEITNFPECLDGRVKTLHPKVHGGILGIRDNEDHQRQMDELEILPIDMVVVNLYPFKETLLKPDSSHQDIVENIDIGGPTMLRSAAKNYNDVAVITDPADYDRVIEAMKSGAIPAEVKMELAWKVFEHTAHYDALIAGYFREKTSQKPSKTLTMTWEKVQDLRYGENPHQSASFYKEVKGAVGSLSNAKQLHGKALSFNNINDANGAIEALKEYSEPTVVAVKHTNPCGIGTGREIFEAYEKAYECDPTSIFGGIVAANREIDAQTAEKINDIFIEIVIAPSFDKKALEILTSKKNIRLLELKQITEREPSGMDLKKVGGGLLVQDSNDQLMKDEFEVATERIPTKSEMEDLLFAWKAVKHIKSNGIVLAKNNQTVSLSPGQVSRIWAVEHAISQANIQVKGSVMASDAFFPFGDCVETAAKAGVTAIVQPGGSVRDQESIDMANKYGITMVFTGMRHFKH
ncbi:bifunctional phosphoribosylaminoimidazolecarboxamide formyltransferase/IMP cyclohydrolase [Fusibacter sp. JL216-2]|uniref:bifunctional phosphoribosylaminoimidazolecarboxamide formyltransferase/IMP cyclohydrolase n=1 Tax=Fusibacter sp. JL216-2 TaxID=3071453 RepID=UPI003D34B2BB